MTDVILNGKSYQLQELGQARDKIPWTLLTPYETRVLQFCRRWLGGQESFSINSSGSTGRPKTITLSRSQMQASARLTARALSLQAGDKALVCLSVQYIAGMMMLVRGFELGLRLTVINPSNNPLAKFAAETRFDFASFVPLQLQRILSDSPRKLAILNHMKAILVGGAPVSLSLQRQLQQVSAPIYHTYGMTETSTHIALRRLNGSRASNAFTPLEGVTVGIDRRGCLTVQSAVTEGETLHTNDLVALNPDGSFVWLGRIDHVINSGGIKVQIEKVEAAVEHLFDHYEDGALARRRFFVGPVDHHQLGQAVVLVVEGEPFSSRTEANIRAALLKALSKYEVPRRFYFLPRLVETPTGKIDRIHNLEKLGSSYPSVSNHSSSFSE